MNDYAMNNDTFAFNSDASDGKTNNFGYTTISGLGESNYENEDLFNTEVSNVNDYEISNEASKNNEYLSQDSNESVTYEYKNNSDSLENTMVLEPLTNNQNITEEVYHENVIQTPYNSQVEQNQNFSDSLSYWHTDSQNTSNNSSTEQSDTNQYSSSEEVQNEIFYPENSLNFNSDWSSQSSKAFNSPNIENEINEEQYRENLESNENVVTENQTENVEDSGLEVVSNEDKVDENKYNSTIDSEYLDVNDSFSNSYLDDNYVLPVVEPSVGASDDSESGSTQKNLLYETPISELEKLTEYTEDKIQTTDIKSLFDRVGVNVKEASDIFKKNTEMKEKIDSRFEELKKLQSEVEKSKKSQYDEINSYKEEVLGKLTEKKEEIEKRLNKLKEFQSTLEKEKQEFEQYRKQEKEEIDRVQREVQEAYDSRREELNHIEDVLRKQKDSLDEERSQLSLDRIQYESDKNELANNLLKFNEIVDSFTNGMDKINKE